MTSKEELKVIPDILARTVGNHPDEAAYSDCRGGSSTWRTLTWSEFDKEVRLWRKALTASGLRKGDHVSVLLPNSIYAAVCDEAILGNALTPVPLHAVDTPSSSAFILNDSESKLLFVPKTLRWNAMTAVCREYPTLREVVVVEEDQVENAESSPVPVLTLKQWLARGESQELTGDYPEPGDLAAIVYTSGTTGKPKGVMLTHNNIVSNVLACEEVLELTDKDSFLSFLPFSHTFERTVTYYLAMLNGSHVYFARSIAKLAEDLQTVKPTVFISVPRVFEQFYAKIKAKTTAKGKLVSAFADQAVDIGWRRFCKANNLAIPASSSSWLDPFLWPLLEKKFAQPVRNLFGGRLRLSISGGASLGNAQGRFFCALGIPLQQGYGLTETSPVLSVNRAGANSPITVGQPLNNVMVRLSDEGELQVRAPSVMKGYWKRPDATAEVFTEDGWLKTGDLAEISENGRVRINGRIKEIIVTSTGEKIPPTDLEFAIQKDPLFEQIMCVGEGRPFISALSVVNKEEFAKLAASFNADPDDPATLERRDIRLQALKRLKRAASSFPQYGVPRNICLLREPWTIDNSLLTVTMKLRRRVIAERFKKEIEQLYETPQAKV